MALIFAALTKFSPARWVCEPMPAWPKVNLPGCAFAASISAFTVL
jgi:hypothetical protein